MTTRAALIALLLATSACTSGAPQGGNNTAEAGAGIGVDVAGLNKGVKPGDDFDEYANGGWPQRFPYDPRYPAYQRDITFNDDVAKENIRLLTMVWQTLREERVLDPIRRGMDAFRLTQMPAPQAGWGLQFDLALRPTGARTYEPAALVTHTTAANVEQLMDYYRLTGDRRFLTGIPAALDWLEACGCAIGHGSAIPGGHEAN